ncbi:CDP-alcohol phosphatidyltransferase family protein, partial [Spirillospora sp. NPDC048819]
GQYAATGNTAYIWTALAVVFLDMLRYMDALEIYKVRSQMRSTLRAARAEAGALRLAVSNTTGEGLGTGTEDVRLVEDALSDDPEALEQRVFADQLNAVLQKEFEQRFPWYIRIRNVLKAGRIRPHLISGIEFQMGVFIIAPIAAALVSGAVIPVVIVSAAGMLAFECVIIYKFWLAGRAYTRSLAGLNEEIDAYRARLPAEMAETAAGSR